MKLFLTIIAATLYAISAAYAADVPVDELENCAFITNDCEVCTIDAKGQPACSSTGIACVPKQKRCLIPEK
jgi:hypothetical protein